MRLGAESFCGLDDAMADRPDIPAADPVEAGAPEAPTPAAPRRSPEQNQRAERLARALRDNLRRRKAPRAPAARPEN